MPEEINAQPTPTTAVQPTAIPSANASPVPENPLGSANLVAEMDKMLSSPEPEQPDKPAAEEKPAEPAVAVKEEKKPEVKVEPKKVEPIKEKDPVQLRKRLAEIEEKYKGLEQTSTNEKRELAEKISAFEKRKYLTPEQEQQQIALQKKLESTEAELYSRDYKESPEFKEKFEKKWQTAYAAAIEEVGSIAVIDENGNERAATRADFDKVRNAPNGLERRRMAKALFGEDAGVVIDHLNNLNSIQTAANEEISTRRLEFDHKRQEYSERMKQEGGRYQQVMQDTATQLVQKYPEFFGEDKENPEINAQLKSGFEFVDKALSDNGSIPVEDKATRASIIRHWAAAFPRLITTVKSKDAKIAELEKTITDLRGSDPGSGGDGGVAPAKTAEAKGIDALVAEFK